DGIRDRTVTGVQTCALPILRRLREARGAVLGLSLVLLLAACGGTSTSSGGPAQSQPPTANMKPPTSIGAGEGQLNLIAWEGYTRSEERRVGEEGGTQVAPEA